MDLQQQEDIQKKLKKKKHNRSRSRSEHKKHKRSRSRSQHKKDKKKKQKSSHDRHHRHRSTSKNKSSPKIEKKQSVKEEDHFEKEQKLNKIQSEKDKNSKTRYTDENKNLDDKYKQEGKTTKNQNPEKNDRDQRREKDRYERREKSRNDDKEKSRNEDREKSNKEDRRQRDSSERLQRKNKDQKKDKQPRRDRDRPQRSYQKEKYRQTSSKYDKYERYDKYDKPDRYDSRRERQRETFRQRSQQKNRRQPQNSDRFGSKRRSRSKQNRQDKRRNQRRRQSRFDAPRFRFDSPPKSDESDMSDDPQKMEKLNRMKAQKQLVTSKADRKLYLGNLPPNITSQQLMDMLNGALKKMEINTDIQGDSIISAWISPDGVGHYAFVEFRTAQQATNGLALNGASLFGYQLKLGRPKQYIEYNKQLLSKYGTDSSIDTIIKKVEAMGGEVDIKITEKIICPPGKVLVLKHIVTVDELAIDEEYQQILDDVKDMAKRYGDVIKVVIPRPHEVLNLEEVQQRVKGLGLIFIQYKTVEQAIFARKQFVQKQFSGRSVACSFFDEKRFRQAEYDICEKVVIDF